MLSSSPLAQDFRECQVRLGSISYLRDLQKEIESYFSILLFRASKFWRENSNLQGVPTSFRKSQIYVKLEF